MDIIWVLYSNQPILFPCIIENPDTAVPEFTVLLTPYLNPLILGSILVCIPKAFQSALLKLFNCSLAIQIVHYFT